MNNKKYYVYVWKTKQDDEVFYVGKGSGNRCTSMKDRNEHFKNIRKKYECYYEIVKYFDDEEKAYEYELELGKYYKSIGQARACHVLGNIRRYIDYETLSKMKKTAFKKNSVPWNKGVKMNEEFRNKCRERQIGKKQSEETKKKRSKALMGHGVSEEAREKIGKAKRKTCVKMNKDTFEIIKEYESLTILAKEMGVELSSISTACKNFPKPYKGYCFKIICHGNPESV